MVKIFVVRHGETELNNQGRYLGSLNPVLNGQGIRQAKELIELFEEVELDVIYTSPLIRCRQTTDIFNRNFKLPVVVAEDLKERNVGVYEGLTKEEVRSEFPDLWAKNITRVWNDAPDGGESIEEVRERVFGFFDQIRESSDAENILIVTHGFVSKMINYYFNQGISEDEFFEFKLGNGEFKSFSLKRV